jgi:hypothetical protein
VVRPGFGGQKIRGPIFFLLGHPDLNLIRNQLIVIALVVNNFVAFFRPSCLQQLTQNLSERKRLTTSFFPHREIYYRFRYRTPKERSGNILNFISAARVF